MAVLFAAVGNNSTANEINCAHTDNCMVAPDGRRRCGVEMKYIAHTPRWFFALPNFYAPVCRRPKAFAMFVGLQSVREPSFSAAVQIFMWSHAHTHAGRRVMRKYRAYAHTPCVLIKADRSRWNAGCIYKGNIFQKFALQINVITEQPNVVFSFSFDRVEALSARLFGSLQLNNFHLCFNIDISVL